jgi:hypothetical protein
MDDHHNITDEKQVNHKQDFVKKRIMHKIGFKKQTNLGISVHLKFDNLEVHQIRPDLIQYLEHESKPKKDEI